MAEEPPPAEGAEGAEEEKEVVPEVLTLSIFHPNFPYGRVDMK